jgi:hypothetical protein
MQFKTALATTVLDNDADGGTLVTQAAEQMQRDFGESEGRMWLKHADEHKVLDLGRAREELSGSLAIESGSCW